MSRRQGCTTDILDIAAYLERCVDLLASKLFAPIGIAHLLPISFAILKYLHTLHTGIAADRNSYGDKFMLTEHFVDKHHIFFGIYKKTEFLVTNILTRRFL